MDDALLKVNKALGEAEVKAEKSLSDRVKQGVKDLESNLEQFENENEVERYKTLTPEQFKSILQDTPSYVDAEVERIKPSLLTLPGPNRS